MNAPDEYDANMLQRAIADEQAERDEERGTTPEQRQDEREQRRIDAALERGWK